MTNTLVAGLIVSAALVASPVAAATQVAAPKSADTGRAVAAQGAGGTATAAAEKKVCKLLPSSSSRMRDRVCLTAKEWKKVDEEVER